MILITFLCAWCVGWGLRRLHIPGGMMVGAVIGASAFGMLSGQAQMPPIAKFIAQIVAGAFIGSGMQREDLLQMRTVLKAAAVVVISLLVVNIVAGTLITRLSPLDPLTALLGSAPGGLSDIPIIAEDLGADAAVVLVLQFVRFLAGIAVFPWAIGKLTKHEDDESEVIHEVRKRNAASWQNTLLTIAISGICGWIGRHSGIPSGTLAFATIGSAIFKLLWPKAGLLPWVRIGAQTLSGAYIGAGIGISQLTQLRFLALPVVLLVACYAGGAVLISLILRRMRLFNRRESLLAATPAGASDMALIAADLGVHNVRLVLMQVIRLITVISFFPTLLSVFARWLSK